MTYICIILLEGITMLIWLNIGFRRRLKIDRKNISMLVFYTTFFYVATIIKAGIWINMASWILLYCWCVYAFSRKLFDTLARFVISILGMGIAQIVALEVLHYAVRGEEVTSAVNYICANLLSILFSLFVYILVVDKSAGWFKVGNYMTIVLLYMAVIMIFIKYDYERHNKAYSDMYMYLFGLLLIMMLVVIRVMKINYQLEQQKYELKLRKEYEETYSGLILEMRRKQHDYKNQIATLYSMRFVEGATEEEWELQKEYGDELIAATTFDEVLFNINNPVLAGYFYTICNQAKRLDIRLKPMISLPETSRKIELHKLVEILGILINNSIEYLEDGDFDEKIINVQLMEKAEKLILEVENTARYIPYSTIEDMFKLGYSTKGKNRGVGMYSLKEIVDSYKGEIIAENIDKQDESWFRIKIVI